MNLKILNVIFSYCLVSFIGLTTVSAEVGSYRELGSIRSDYAAFKAFDILNLDLTLNGLEKAKQNLEIINSLAQVRNDNNLLCVYYEAKAHYYSITKDRMNDSSTFYYEKALKVAQEYNLKNQIFRQTFNIGQYYYTYANYADAYRYFRQSIILKEEFGEDKIGKVWLYYLSLSRFFYEIKEYDTSLHLLNDVLRFSKELSSREFFNTLNTMGLIAYHTGYHEKALEYYQKVLEKSNEVLDSAWMGISFGNMGDIYENRKNYSKALEYYGLDYKYNTQPSGDILSALGSLKKIAELQYTRKDYTNSLVSINSYLTQIEKKPARYKSIVDAYKLKVKLLDTIGSEEAQFLAFKELNRYDALLESLNSTNNLDLLKLKEEQERFDTLYLNARKYKDWFTYLLVCVAALLVIVAVLYLKKGQREYSRFKKLNVEDDKAESAVYSAMEILSDKRYSVTETSKSKQISLELRALLDLNLLNNRNWEKFTNAYENDFPGFFSNLKLGYPELSDTDLRLLSLINLNISNKELANKLSVSLDAIKKAKQRLKKKLIGNIIYN